MGYHVINGEKFFVHGGDIAIIDYNIPHKFICSEKHLDIINCIFKPSLYFKATENFKSFSDLLNTYIFMPFSDFSFKNFTITHFSGNDKMLIDNIFDKIFYEYSYKKYGFLQILRGYVIELISHIIRNNAQINTPANDDTVIKYFTEYIIKNYSKHISTDDFAKNAFLSKSQFCRRFKKYTSLTITDFIQKTRTEEACRLLLTTNRKIEDIGESVGYRDLKFFNQVFKRYTGKTPSEFRKNK